MASTFFIFFCIIYKYFLFLIHYCPYIEDVVNYLLISDSVVLGIDSFVQFVEIIYLNYVSILHQYIILRNLL